MDWFKCFVALIPQKGNLMEKKQLPIEELNLNPAIYRARKAIQFLVPVLYFFISSSFYLRTYDSAQVKITLLQMGGFSLIALWISLIFIEGKRAFRKTDFIFLAPFLSYLLYIVFSFINVPYKEWALDDFTRYIIYTFISLIVIREFDLFAVNRLTKFLLAAAWVASIYGLVQWIDINFYPPRGQGDGLDPFIWRGAFGSRIFSTYGNPNFFANFMVLMLPVIISQYLKKRSFPLLILAALDIFCIIKTYTKGAWIGFGISSILFAAIYLYYFTKLNKKRLLLIYGIFVLLGFSVVVWVVNYAFHNSKTSVPFRVATWLSTWEIIETHPLIGSGVGSFRPLYPAYRRPIIFHLEGKHNTETDHAENEHLEQIMDNGMLGAGIFYWIIIFVTVTALRAIKFHTENENRGSPSDIRYDILGYLVAYLGMLTHNFTDVSLRFVSSGVYLGLLPAVIINLSRGHALWEFYYMEDSDTAKKNKGKEEKKELNFFSMIFSFITVGVIIFVSFVIINQFHKLQGNFSSYAGGGDLFLWLVSWGLVLFLIFYVGYSLSYISLKVFNPKVNLVILLCLIPVYYFWGWFKADVYHNLAIFYSKRGDWDMALNYYQKVVKNNPTFIMPYYFMGNVFTDRFNMDKIYKPAWGDKNEVPRTDFERALSMYEKVRSMAPNYVQMHHQVGVLYMKMYDYLIRQGKVEEAKKYLDKAMHRFHLYQNLDPVFPYNYYRRAQIWILKGEYEKAEHEYLNYINGWKCNGHKFLIYHNDYEMEHKRPDAYTNLGNLYMIMGKYEKAYEMYKKALERDPNFGPAKRNIIAAEQKLKKHGNK